jgi:cytochrome P450
MRASSKHEFLLYLINQPALLVFAEAIRPYKCLYLPKVGYLINDAHLATEILKHPSFSSGGRGGMGSLISPIVGKYGLFNMDGDLHRQFKQQSLQLFSRDYMKHVLNIAGAETLAQLAADLLAGRTVDLVAFTRQFTTRIMLYMFGVDLHKIDVAVVEAKITHSVERFMSRLHLTKLDFTDDELAQIFQMIEEVNTLIENNQRQYQDDSLLKSLAELGLSRTEAYGLMYSLLVAGTETTNVSIPRIVALLLDSEQYADLKANPGLMNRAIEEGIRVTTASPMIPRAIEGDTTLSGYHFKAGRRVLMLVYNMLKQNYDMEHATSFDIHRSVPPHMKHLNFGHGSHFCLGFPLAHLEIEQVLKTLLSLSQSPEIVSRSYSRGKTFPAYTSLAIQLIEKSL